MSQLKPNDFVHLHNHTQYSLLDGLTKIGPLVEKIKSFGSNAVAVTDHGTLSGTIEFYKEAKETGIKPIIGIETYVAPRGLDDRDPEKDKNNFHLILLAMNAKGYQNLAKLSTLANLNGFYYRPRIDKASLKKFSEGLIVLSGCIGGEVGDLLRQNQYANAKAAAEWYKSVFGDRYYLELQDHGHPEHPNTWSEQTGVNQQLLKLGKELDIKCVVTADAHYLEQSNKEAHEILLCIQTGSFMSDEKRMSLAQFDLSVADPKEIIKRWGKEHRDLITNTKEIADRCDVNFELGKILIPKFPIPGKQNERSFLEQQVYQGLIERYSNSPNKTSQNFSVSEIKKRLPEPVLSRAGYELGVINDMGFCGYFLIIADFINWGKKQGIVFGPGRGSAAGSIISYALKITELDPLNYDLLFERFLNPDRISMPDIDIDIQDNRRDEVIQYCVEKYGADKVANIVTFGRMAARNSIRDVARVLQVPYAEADRLAKMVPPPVQGRHIPLEKSIKDDSNLRREYASNKDAKRVFDLAVQLEGTIRSHGVHAAGVVIAPDDIVKFTPLEMAQKGVVATQFPMGPIEELGLLKIDFLGLSNLTIIKNALRIIKKVYSKDIDISTIALDDTKTFKLFQNGDTTGVFQLESAGMKRYLKELKPTVFGDIIAMGALYRPGPLTAGLTDKFIARKNGLEKVKYDHKLMENALKDTYGVMVYQEQFMQIARDMCGFSGGESDTLRKAVGKKIRTMMAKMKSKIIDGAVKNGVDKAVAEKFWKDLEGFADYAFNKSHAAAYGLISYQTAYLKAHYPAAFMAALMTSDFDDNDRLAIEVSECTHMGIDVLPPDINESFLEFAVVPGKDAIRFSLAAIKNVGKGAVEEIVKARQDKEFSSIEDFLRRVNPRIVNRKTMESLIRAGAFDSFINRNILIHNLDTLLAYSSRVHKQSSSGQTDLFGDSPDEVLSENALNFDNVDKYSDPREVLSWERELLGIYLSSHPLEAYVTILKKKVSPINSLAKHKNNQNVKIGGFIDDVKEISARNGQKMAFIKVVDMESEAEVVVFPSVYKKAAITIERDKVVIVTGKVSLLDKQGNKIDPAKVLASDVIEIESQPAMDSSQDSLSEADEKIPSDPAGNQISGDKQSSAATKLYIRLNGNEPDQHLNDLRSLIDKNQGKTEVVLVVGNEDNLKAIRLPQTVEASDTVMKFASEIFGNDNVKIS